MHMIRHDFEFKNVCPVLRRHFADQFFERLFKKWAELPGALPRHHQKCSLTYPKTYTRSAFLAASKGIMRGFEWGVCTAKKARLRLNLARQTGLTYTKRPPESGFAHF